jgi:flavorubredoxin
LVNITIREVEKNLYLLRIDDSRVKYFEALWDIPEGITYNAYVLETDEGAILFDGWKDEYSNEFIKALGKIINPNNIKFIVVHHMEPDHTGSLKKVLKAADYKPEVIGRPMVKDMIKSFYGIEVKFRPVKDVEELRIGGYNLTFIPTPWLHWPETMVTYIKEFRALLTCDVFGGYGIPHGVFDDEEPDINLYLKGVKKYLTTVIGSYKAHIIKNIEKLLRMNVEIKIIAPGHGLIWRRDPKRIINYYYHLAKGEVKERKAVVVYDSMYGFVEKAISTVLKVLEENGFVINVFKFKDKERPRISDILSEATDSSFIILGISTYENDLFPLMKSVMEMLVKKVNREIPVLIVSSYGWGPVLRSKVLEILKDSRFKIINIFQFRGRPDEDFEDKVRNLIERTFNLK